MRLFVTVFLLAFLLGGQVVPAEELFDVEAANEHFNKGLTLYFKKDYAGAIEEFNEAIRINPENAKAYYFMGYAYYKEREFDKASEAFETAYEMDSRYSPIPGSAEPPGAPPMPTEVPEEVEIDSGSPN